MRTLYLLRHAKASSGSASNRDFDRTLVPEGREAAANVGVRLAGENLAGPHFVSSPAVRARETAEIVLSKLDRQYHIQMDSRIYEADLPALLATLSGIKSKKKVVVLVGHNPGLESLLRFLTTEIRAMPTAGLAKIVLRSELWSDLHQGEGALDWLVAG